MGAILENAPLLPEVGDEQSTGKFDDPLSF
jgi:hypothetical protein